MKCHQCGLLAIAPDARIPEDILYTENYYNGTDVFSYKDERKQEYYEKFVWNARIKNIKIFKQQGNFLDIGSSFGGLLAAAKSSGFNPTGLEVSAFSANYSKNRGIPTIQKNFLAARLPENSFDVVTMIEVLEHLSNPAKVFSKLQKIINKNGLLIIQTANFDAWQAIDQGPDYHYFLPGHYYYYNKDLLTRILKENGFHKFIFYPGVDFGLLPKLLKSRGNFKSVFDYLSWFKIAFYHLKSGIIYKNKPLTSSMVLYAFKK